MKVLITHEIFPPEFLRGGELLTYRIAHFLVKNGHSVKVLTSGNPKIKSYMGIETIRIPINRYAMNLIFPIVLKYASWADLIQTSSGNLCLPSWFAAKILKKPICCYVHHIFGHYWKDVRGPLLGRLFENLEKFFLSKDFDAIIFQNKSSLRLGKKIKLKAKKSFLIHPGIDFKKFKIRKKEEFVLFVGTTSMDKPLANIKGVKYLIECARKLPEVKFIIVGGGKGLEELKKTSPNNVVFKGALRGNPLFDIYSRALIFCLPSLAEGFGLTILEAMASGCAIVSTVDLGQKGILIKPKNSNQIKNAIEHLLKNRAESIEIGKENRRLVRKFTWDKFFKDIIKIYNSIIRK